MKELYEAVDWISSRITKVLSNKETEKCVWVERAYRKGTFDRRNKVSNDVCYFHTFQEAKDWLVEQAEKEVLACKKALQNAEEALERRKSLTTSAH